MKLIRRSKDEWRLICAIVGLDCPIIEIDLSLKFDANRCSKYHVINLQQVGAVQHLTAAALLANTATPKRLRRAVMNFTQDIYELLPNEARQDIKAAWARSVISGASSIEKHQRLKR